MIPTSAILRFAPIVAAVILVGLAFWWADHRGYARGVADTNARIAVAAEKIRVQTERMVRVLETSQEERDAAIHARIEGYRSEGERIANVIREEARRDPAVVNCMPMADVLRDQLNAARRKSAVASPGR